MNITKFKKRAVSLAMASLLLTGAFTFQAFAKERSVHSDNCVGVAFEVMLEFDGEMPVEHEPFTFILEEEDGSPLPDSTFVNIDGEGVAEFDEIDFTEPGEYIYHVYERDDGVENFIYDDSVYTIDVDVKYDNNGQLIATYVAYNGEAKEPEIMFINEYDDSIPIPPDDTEPTEEPTETTVPSEEPTTSEVPASTTAETPAESTNPSVQPSNSTTNSASGATSPSSTPKTGDYTNNLVWMLLLCAAIIGMLFCLRYFNVVKNRNAKQDKK